MSTIVSMPHTINRVQFANDNPETLMKPTPIKVVIFNKEEAPNRLLISNIHQLADESLHDVKYGTTGAYIPPHLRKGKKGIKS